MFPCHRGMMKFCMCFIKFIDHEHPRRFFISIHDNSATTITGKAIGCNVKKYDGKRILKYDINKIAIFEKVTRFSKKGVDVANHHQYNFRWGRKQLSLKLYVVYVCTWYIVFIRKSFYYPFYQLSRELKSERIFIG